MTIALPVDALLPELVRVLAESRAVVLEAPTGAGKTTRVPPALLDAMEGEVLVLEPRRLAARAAARRMASERGGRLGDEVGYRVRLENRTGPRTRLCVMTEGILVRRLQDDPMLEGVACVVFDELHERGVSADLALAMTRRVQLDVRPDLAIVAMSATLDAGPLSAFLGDAPCLKSEGRLFPVERMHLPREGREALEAHVVRGVRAALEHPACGTGDVLVFLPGVGEIRRAERALEGAVRRELVPLYGDLPPERQDAALRPGDAPRVVLATNVAETSVTLPGVTAVVDTGLVRRLEFDPGAGLDRLRVTRASRASADQRAGRAGRTAPGVCVRLWSPLEERGLSPHETPEVTRVDLAPAVLELLAWGERDPRAFPWLEAPPGGSLERAMDLLVELEAVRDGALTPLGRAMARLPVHPRLARLLIEGERSGIPGHAALAAALLAERDPFHRERVGRDAPAPTHVSDSDLADRVHALADFERDGRSDFPFGRLPRGSGRARLSVADQLARLASRALGALGEERGEAPASTSDALLRAAFRAWPDRLARRRAPGSDRAVSISGRGVRVARESAVREAMLFVCLDLDAGSGEALARQVSAVEEDWLDPAGFTESLEPEWDAQRERVVAKKRRAWRGLVLDEVEAAAPLGEDTERVLCEAARRAPAHALGLSRPELAGFLARARSLAAWRPELGLPAFDDADLAALVPQFAGGARSFADLRRAPLVDVWMGRLTHAQRTALAQEAPERIEVMSGSKLRLAYDADDPSRPPVLAVRIQELFGMEETPTVAGGRVRVLLHLCAPNGRPQQVTDDLASFWSNTYTQVRKDLRARYPKHAWPEDPRQGKAERRPGRRR